MRMVLLCLVALILLGIDGVSGEWLSDFLLFFFLSFFLFLRAMKMGSRRGGMVVVAVQNHRSDSFPSCLLYLFLGKHFESS